MKKLQVFFAVLSMVIGIGGAFAFTPKEFDPCPSTQLYYFNDQVSQYHRITTTGICLGTAPFSCKFYKDASGNLIPCGDVNGRWVHP